MNSIVLPQAQQIVVHPDLDALSTIVATRIATLAKESIAERGVFHFVLTGGETPRKCYEKLRVLDVDWSKVHVYFGDERCLPLQHPQRNDSMAYETLLQHVAIPAENIHAIASQLDPKLAAEQYAETVSGIDYFDLTLLGMGEDGHTASLFPDNPSVAQSAAAVAVFNSPKPPSERVSLGLDRINRSHHKLFLVAGAGKRNALQQIAQGVSLPAAQVLNAEWHLDRAAATPNS